MCVCVCVCVCIPILATLCMLQCSIESKMGALSSVIDGFGRKPIYLWYSSDISCSQYIHTMHITSLTHTTSHPYLIPHHIPTSYHSTSLPHTTSHPYLIPHHIPTSYHITSLPHTTSHHYLIPCTSHLYFIPGQKWVPYPDKLIHTPSDHQGAGGTEGHGAHTFGDLEHLVVVNNSALGWDGTPQPGPSSIVDGAQEVWRCAPSWGCLNRWTLHVWLTTVYS